MWLIENNSKQDMAGGNLTRLSKAKQRIPIKVNSMKVHYDSWILWPQWHCNVLTLSGVENTPYGKFWMGKWLSGLTWMKDILLHTVSRRWHEFLKAKSVITSSLLVATRSDDTCRLEAGRRESDSKSYRALHTKGLCHAQFKPRCHLEVYSWWMVTEASFNYPEICCTTSGTLLQLNWVLPRPCIKFMMSMKHFITARASCTNIFFSKSYSYTSEVSATPGQKESVLRYLLFVL